MSEREARPTRAATLRALAFDMGQHLLAHETFTKASLKALCAPKASPAEFGVALTMAREDIRRSHGIEYQSNVRVEPDYYYRANDVQKMHRAESSMTKARKAMKRGLGMLMAVDESALTPDQQTIARSKKDKAAGIVVWNDHLARKRLPIDHPADMPRIPRRGDGR